MRKEYAGQLVFTSNGEEYNILGIVINARVFILSEIIAEDIEEYGNYLTISYYTSDSLLDKNSLISNFNERLFGLGRAEYAVHYSEITGYLWTDEELIVGGHNLLDELKSKIGKFLYLIVDFNRTVSGHKENIK